MRRIALFSSVLAVTLTVLPVLDGRAAETFTGACEDIHVPGFPAADNKGTPTDDLSLIPSDLLEKAVDDCVKRANRLLMKDQRARLALARHVALRGDRAGLPELLAAADQGVVEASYVISILFLVSGPYSPADPQFEELPRSSAEAHLRKAAEAGLPGAMYRLGRGLATGILVKRDEREARTWQARLEEQSRRTGDKENLGRASLELAAIALASKNPPQDDQARLAELARQVEAAPLTAPYARWIEIRGRRLGIGWPKDEAKARELAEAAQKAGGVPTIDAEYAELLAASTDPADRLKLAELLERIEPRNSALVGQVVAPMLYSGAPAGRDRARAIVFFAEPAWSSHDDAVVFARRALESDLSFKVPPQVAARLYEAIDLGIPGADAATYDLLTSSRSDLVDTVKAKALARLLQARSEPMRLRLLAEAAETGPASLLAPFDTKEAAAAALDQLVAANVAEALRIKAMALRKGTLYRQDDVAATEYLIKAAEGGDVPAMLLLADAYDSGTGIEEDSEQEIRWIKAAMRAGSAEGEQDFVSLLPFRSGYKDYSVHDAVVLGMAQQGDKLNVAFATPSYDRVFSSIETDRLGVDYVITALMNGFRASLALRRDEAIVTVFKQVPKELTLKVEEVLKAEGFLTSKPRGFMGPEARTALMQWARAKGLPEMEGDAQPVSARADHRLTNVPVIPAERIARIRERVLQDLKSDPKQKAATEVLQMLAQYGDVQSRLEIMRAYAGSNKLQPSVVLGLVILYGLDALAADLPPEEKVDIDFTFAATNVVRVGQGGTAADVVLITLRDDPRLQDFGAFDKIADRFIFIGGLCDALAERAQANAIPGMEADACSGASRRAMLAWAKAKGPDGSEATIRRQAADYLQKLPD